MEQYIPKAALVAEIEKLIRENELYLSENVSDTVRFSKTGAYSVLNDLLHFLDTLEVKEVDLEREFDIEDAVHGTVDYPLIGHDFPNIFPNYKELKEYCDRKGIKDNDKVKLIIIKDM